MRAAAPDWTCSTLFFVRDVDRAVGFYLERLGFALNMRYEEDGVARVAGVSRGPGCALLLTSQWPDRVGTGVLYSGLDADHHAAVFAEFAARGAAVGDGFWGKPISVLEDPDGNQLWFGAP